MQERSKVKLEVRKVFTLSVVSLGSIFEII